MKKKTSLIITGAGGLLALGLAIPAVAFAADPAPGPSTSGNNAPADPQQRHAAERADYAAALAKELAISQDKVTAAMDKVDAQMKAKFQADRQAALKARLDQAVKDGKLTQAQADAILKAAESGVLGGPDGRIGGFGHGHGGPGFRPPR
jgi:hypothetical protein